MLDPVVPTAPPHWRRASGFLRPHARPLLAVVVLALIGAAAGVAEPLVLKRFFDVLAAPAPGLGDVAMAAGAIAVLGVGRTLLQARADVRTWDLRLAVDFDVRAQVIGKLNTLPVAYHQARTVGGTMTAVNQSVSGFVAAGADLALKTLPSVAYLLLSVVAMWRLDYRLCLTVLILAPLPALVGGLAATEQTTRERRLLQHWTAVYARFNEVLAGIRTVKSFAMEQEETRRFLTGSADGNTIVRRGVRVDARVAALQSAAALLARIAALALGGWLVVRGEITAGTLVAFLGFVSGLFGPIQGLTSVYQTLRKASVALETIGEILDAPDIVADQPHARPVTIREGEIVFDRVTFAYGAGPTVLRDVSLRVAPGETVAFVGPSGSGKTTLMSLVERLHPLADGCIRIDGVDVRDMTQRDLRRQLGSVSQEVHLFNDTVHANVAYGMPGATRDDVEVACRAAHAHDFVRRFPQGYETVVGERGALLSGGQRQRIAIARALLLNPPILVLDEATSALDSESESLVHDAIHRLTRGRTTLVVAHRLSTVVDADRVVVLRDGAIEAIGTHEELLRAGGWYAQQWSRQRMEEVEEVAA
ncbi:MAG TPA: ABC transporter ATP-binding protein [Gemmatimonadaceae bacterium]|nr:ABC transporter ATP-binding protein [Gemmatimonadaceae bacterium]